MCKMVDARVTTIIADEEITIKTMTGKCYDKFDTTRFKRDYPSLHNQYSKPSWRDDFIQIKGV